MASTNSTTPAPTSGDEVQLMASASLDTKLDAAFGILGAVLITSGVALAVTGSAYKRLTCAVVTTYAMAMVIMALVLHYGVEKQIDPPSSGIRVAFVIASLGGGLICGLAAAIFHRGAKVFIAPVAGFSLGLVIQSLRNDGLIHPIGPRYFLYLGLAGVAFICGLIPRFFDMVVLLSTAFLGAFALAIGMDCFSTAGLKEFLVMNIGFSGIFPRLEKHFTISSVMQIELGLIAIVFCISIAIQIRLFGLFEKRLARLFARKEEEEKRRLEDEAADRISRVLDGDIEKFEHRYSRRFPFHIPGSLPSAPNQVHLDNSKMDSPSLSSHAASVNTPRSEAAPLLPELNYVSTRPVSLQTNGDPNTAGMKSSESNKSFLMQVRSFMNPPDSRGNDIPPVPTIDLESQREIVISPIDSRHSYTPVSPRSPSSAVRASMSSESGGHASGSSGNGDKEELAKEIAAREHALQEIQTIRRSIDVMRTRLRSQSQSDSSENGASRPTSPRVGGAAVPKPPAGHRATVSFSNSTLQHDNRRNSNASFTAPRPVSQHSVITVQSVQKPNRAVVAGIAPYMHDRSHSQTSINRARPTSGYSFWGAPDPAQIGKAPNNSHSRQHSAMTVTTGRTMSTGSIQQVQRVVTGVMPARPASQQPPPHAQTGTGSQNAQMPDKRQSIPRTQTMDILDLDARHKRRMSQMQGAISGTNPSEQHIKSETMTKSASQPAIKTADSMTKKRSSTMNGIANIPTSSLPVGKSAKRRMSAGTGGVDELGRPTPTAVKAGVSPSSTMPAIGASKTLGSVTKDAAIAVKTAAGLVDVAKSSEAAWLSY